MSPRSPKTPKPTPEPLRALASKAPPSYDHPDARILERFPSPQSGATGELTIQIVAPEFTSLCPLTGQPDFATIVVDYEPGEWCVESKSLKLYLGAFRQHGEFHEKCVDRILNDLVALLEPRWMTVHGQFTPRGGIRFWPRATYRRE